MTKTFIVAALSAACSATNIIYKTGRGRQAHDYRVYPQDWKMTFAWPFDSRYYNGGHGCSAVMISDQVAVTAAHCVKKSDVSKKRRRKTVDYGVVIGKYALRTIVEIRVDDCWNFKREGPFSNDLAMLFLNRPVTDAVRGEDYVELWNPADHEYEDLTGAEFILAGYGEHGNFVPGQTDHLDTTGDLYRGYNNIREISNNQFTYTMDKGKKA